MVGAAAEPRPREPLQIERRDPGDGVDGARLGRRGVGGREWERDGGRRGRLLELDEG